MSHFVTVTYEDLRGNIRNVKLNVPCVIYVMFVPAACILFFSEVPITTYLLLEEISCEFKKFKYGAQKKKRTGEGQIDINHEKALFSIVVENEVTE